MTTNPAVLAHLAHQDGLLTTAQAARCGPPSRTLRRDAAEAGWERVAPRVLLAAGHPFTDRARIRSAGSWGGERATVSGPAAAWWHGTAGRAPSRVLVTAPRRSGLRAVPGTRVRRRDLDDRDRLQVDGLWLTDLPLTALETAARIPDGSVFLDRALQRHVRFPRSYESYCRNRGAHGAAAIGRLLGAAADRADPAAERLAIRLLRDAGVGGWEHGRPFGRWTIDIAFPGARVAVEVDGWAWHMDVDRFRADRHKGNALVREGWDLLRFTWHDLTLRPEYVVGEIRAALAAAAAARRSA
jgi:very-short-patch-repair endonuclease